MKFKFKIDDKTTLDDVRKELNSLKSANVIEIPLNHLRRIIEFLGATAVPATGSSVRFSHPILRNHPYYHGFFQVHKLHGGGNDEKIRMTDYKKIVYPTLITIIDLKDKK